MAKQYARIDAEKLNLLASEMDEVFQRLNHYEAQLNERESLDYEIFGDLPHDERGVMISRTASNYWTLTNAINTLGIKCDRHEGKHYLFV